MKDFSLSILDQTMFRLYVRHLMFFEFPDPGNYEDAVNALQVGFAITLRQIPFLAGDVRLSDPEMGRVALQYPSVISDELLAERFTSNRNHIGNPELNYSNMEKAGFPPIPTWRDVFCPELLRSHPGHDDEFAEGPISFKKGQSVPVLAAQATLIRGGLVMSVYSHHSVIDGTGIAKVYQIWSSHTKRHNLMPIPVSPEDCGDIHADPESQRCLLNKLAESSDTIDCPEVRFPGSPRSAPTLREKPYKLASRIFVFPETKMSDLATKLTKATNRRTSSFVALASLMWTNISIARSATLTKHNILNTKLGIAFDHRRNFDSNFKDTYLGNCVTEVQASCPVSEMLSTPPDDSNHGEQLLPAALAISEKLDTIDLNWLKPRLNLFSRTSNSWQLRADADEKNGPDLFVTSWMYIGTDCAWGIPGTTTEGPVAIRRPQAHVEGLIHFFPKVRRENGISVLEVLLCLEESEVEKLVRRLEDERWVVRTIDA